MSRETRGGRHTVVLVDRVFEHSYLSGILRRLFSAAMGARFKSDDATLNLALLSLQVRGRGSRLGVGVGVYPPYSYRRMPPLHLP